jgi:hypothetical protein
MITLVCGDQELTVSILEAENVLRIQDIMKATQWELPTQFQRKEDGTIIRPNKRAGTGKAPKE